MNELAAMIAETLELIRRTDETLERTNRMLAYASERRQFGDNREEPNL